jgi:transcriptional regulator with XRE-family HTH domain
MLRLRFERLKKGISQVDLADMTGVHQSSISDFEIGERIPSEVQLEVIARVLDVAPARILLQPTFVVHDVAELVS